MEKNRNFSIKCIMCIFTKILRTNNREKRNFLHQGFFCSSSTPFEERRKIP
jgi:hypothetical protein